MEVSLDAPAKSENATQMEIASKSWEISNQIQEVSSIEEIYKNDEFSHRNLLNEKPWEKPLDYFKSVKVSALTLLKIDNVSYGFICFNC